MSRRAYLYFLITFLLGIVVGGVGAYSYGWYTGQWRRKSSRHNIVDYLQRKLELSASQTQQLRQIVSEMQTKMREVQKQVEPQFQAVREEARDRTKAILNPQQTEKFNEMVKHWDEWRKKHPPPPPH
ncbi:MAG: periplasmic heavy metal sensor [Acidobacteria bacterium]|nr:periplasmic heavy metal sensor [Acidobacteriota bacterium]